MKPSLELGLATAIGLLLLFAIALFAHATTAKSHVGPIPDVAQRAAESVVRIDVVVPVTGGLSSGEGARVRATNGSGFVHDGEGRIVTAAHVVADAIDIRVVVAPGDIRPARVVGFDIPSDVAVIAVDGPLPPPLEIDRDQPVIAAPIAAIGAPYWMDRSVSRGVVSGVGRARRPGAAAILLQHDAAVNPGSSGGPVVTADGRVAGINVSIPDGQFEFAGIAFAIEGPVLARVVEELIAEGRVRRGHLGVAFRALDPLTRAAVPSLPAGAAVVTDIERDGPAARAGLRLGDIVLAAGGERLFDLSNLLRILDNSRAGDRLSLVVQQEGATREIGVTLAPVTLTRDAASPPDLETGLEIAESAPARIAAVREGSPAAAAGLRGGDVLLGVDLALVPDGHEARQRLALAEGLTAVLVKRGDFPARLFVLGADPADAGILGGNSQGVLSARR